MLKLAFGLVKDRSMAVRIGEVELSDLGAVKAEPFELLEFNAALILFFGED